MYLNLIGLNFEQYLHQINADDSCRALVYFSYPEAYQSNPMS